jgi:hypothetical protein
LIRPTNKRLRFCALVVKKLEMELNLAIQSRKKWGIRLVFERRPRRLASPKSHPSNPIPFWVNGSHQNVDLSSALSAQCDVAVDPVTPLLLTIKQRGCSNTPLYAIMSSSEQSSIEERIQNVKDAVRKATAEAMKTSSSSSEVPQQQQKSTVSSKIQENNDPNESTKASFNLGMTLFGQEIHVVERQIRDKLDSVEKELQAVVLEVQKQQSMIPEEEEHDEDMTEEVRNVLSQDQSVEALEVEAQELQVKIQFLKECSTARSLLDEATIVSSSGTAYDPDWVEAARMLQKAQASLEQAEMIVSAEEERALSGEAAKQALLGAYRIMDSIRVPMRRKRVELLAKATDLLNNSITVTEDSISVQGSRLGSQADGINAAHDMLEALAPGDHTRWNDAVRLFADRLFKIVFEPQLKAHKTGVALTTSWKFEEIADTGSKGLSGRIAVTSSKKKGPSYTLEWTREHTSPPASTEEDVVISWGQTFAFVQRVMSFVEQRVLLQREDLCQYVGKRLFGARTDRPGNTISLAALGLESDLIGDDSGSFLRPALRLLRETCIPSYLAPGELGRLKALSDKLSSFVAPFEETLISKHFISRAGEKPFPFTDFSTHLEQKYVEQRRVSILNEARRILLDTDYHNTTEVGVDVSGAKDELLGDDDGMAVFQLHKSSISQTASKLMDLCRRTMDEAVESVIEDTSSPLALLPPNLYRGAREILDLFRAIVPATLGNEVATVPRTAAVLHNDCVFLAHHCLTLGLEYKEKFPPSSSEDDARGKVLRQTCIFVDMVPPFRELAQKSMGEMLERQQGQLWEIVGSRITFLGKSLRSNETVAEWTEAETAVKAGLYHLRHLSQAWRPILSHEVFVRSIAHLSDVIFAMLVDQVLKAMAVSVPASQFVSALFNTAVRGASDILNVDVVVCRNWDRFTAIGRFMDMSLADINAGLSEGVFRSVTASELSRLITVTFDESQKRQALLQLLAAEK